MLTKKKKGVSTVVATVLIIALTMALVSIVWVVVKNLVSEQTGGATSCFNLFDKVKLNSLYTCYNNTNNANEIWISIDVGEISNIEDILVGVSGEGQGLSFKIIEDNPPELEYYNRTRPVTIPGESQGLTYIYHLPSSFTKAPDLVEIAPIIDGKQCEKSSSIEQIDSCSSIV